MESTMSTKKLTIQEVECQFRKIHGNKYSYNWLTYKNSREKIEIICKYHGIFEQTPSCHKSGRGCPKCASEKQIKLNKLKIIPFEEIVNECNIIHNNKYKYHKDSYVSSNKKMDIECSIHGIFKQTPNSHKRGQGCPKCANENHAKLHTLTFDIQLNAFRKIHGNKYTYCEESYINTMTKMSIICPIHGIFKQTPNSHKSGSGCPLCKRTKIKKNQYRYTGNIKNDINNFKTTKNKAHHFKSIYNYYKTDIDNIITHSSNPIESIYCYNNDITTQPICLECGNPVKFVQYDIGYRQFCSVKCASNNSRVKHKRKLTCLKKYGVEYTTQSQIAINKKMKTWNKKYGCHPMQNSDINNKCVINSYKYKNYILPSGKIIKVQGYEPFAIDILLNEMNYTENQLITNCVEMPEIWYVDENNTKHRYYPDIFIPHENKLIEVKSSYTITRNKKKNSLKRKASANLKFNHEFWVIENKKIVCII